MILKAMMPRYRSKLEGKVAKLLPKDWEYEATKVPYTMHRNYTPDFTKGDVYIEVKGYFWPYGSVTYSRDIILPCTLAPMRILAFSLYL